MFAPWPEYSEYKVYPDEEQAVDRLKSVIKGIRAVRLEMNVPAAKKITAVLVSQDKAIRDFFTSIQKTFAILAGAKETAIQEDKACIDDNAVSVESVVCKAYRFF